jgi:hypothetical protein
MGFASHLFRLLGLRGLSAQIRFGEEVGERVDRFVLSEMAQARVATMFEELGEPMSVVAGERSRTDALEAILN